MRDGRSIDGLVPLGGPQGEREAVMDVGSAIESIKNALSLFVTAIQLAREAKKGLPEGPEKKAVEQSLEAAERSSKLAEAQIADALGYLLCKCTFPPQVMLKTGYSREHGEHYQCPACGHTWPPQGGIRVETEFNVFGD